MAAVSLVLTIPACAHVDPNVDSYSAQEQAKADSAIRMLLEKAGTAAPETMFVTAAGIADLSAYLPAEAQSVIGQLDIIPGFRTDCQRWLAAVYEACTSVSMTIPSRMGRIVRSMEIPEPMSIVNGSATSATSLLDDTWSDQLERELTAELEDQFARKPENGSSIDEQWNRIVEKYDIWRKAQMNLSPYSGKPVPAQIGGNIASHVATLISDMFFTQMAIEEDAIRTTPRPQDDSLIAQVFTIPAQP